MRRKKPKKNPNKVISIDPSPSGTGIALFNKGILVDFWFCTKAPTVAEKNERAILIPEVARLDESARMERLRVVRDFVVNKCKKHKPCLVGIEDYIHDKKKIGGLIQIGELGGVLRLALLDNGYTVRTYLPSSVKIYVVGNGNVDKQSVINAVSDYIEEVDSPVKEEYQKLSRKYLEAVSDACAVGLLLWDENLLRRGEWELEDDSPKNLVKVFDTLANRPYMEIFDDEF